MDDPRVVGLLQRLDDLPEDGQGSLDGERPVFLQDVEERAPLDEPHGQEAQPLALTDVMDANHVLVGDLAREHQLPPEPLDPLRVRPQVGAEDLERDVDAQLLVPRLVDGAHPPDAERAEDAVAPRHHRARGEAAGEIEVRVRVRWIRSGEPGAFVHQAQHQMAGSSSSMRCWSCATRASSGARVERASRDGVVPASWVNVGPSLRLST